MTYDDIMSVNKELKTLPITHRKKDGTTVTKQYAEVNQRIMAFRKLFPMGTLTTDILSCRDGVVVMKATASADGVILGEGIAYEKEGSSFINEDSYIENCQTSAIGRALGMVGIGIDTSVASYEEMANALEHQSKRKASPKQIAVLKKNLKDIDIQRICEEHNIERIEDITLEEASALIGRMKGGR